VNQSTSIYQLFDVLQKNVPSIREAQLNAIQNKQSQDVSSTEAEISAILQRTKSSVDDEYTAYSYRSRVFFLVSLAVAAITIALICVGLILIFADNVFFTTAIPITFIVGAVNIISTLILVYVRVINNKRDELARQLRILDEISIAMNYITRLQTKEKEEAIGHLVEQLLSSVVGKSKIKSNRDLAMSPEEMKVFAAFENPNYDWRTVEGIAKETGLPTSDIIRILESSDEIVRSAIPDKSGRVLYTTKSFYMSRKNMLHHILSVLSDKIR